MFAYSQRQLLQIAYKMRMLQVRGRTWSIE